MTEKIVEGEKFDEGLSFGHGDFAMSIGYPRWGFVVSSWIYIGVELSKKSGLESSGH